jgi:hypothetical protein
MRARRRKDTQRLGAFIGALMRAIAGAGCCTVTAGFLVGLRKAGLLRSDRHPSVPKDLVNPSIASLSVSPA